MDAVAVHLACHDFKALFVEVLGWDNASAEHHFEADGQTFKFRLIAHKRGFQVLVCEADRYTLFNRRRLRELERQVFRLAHEHIVIYTCSEPGKQVWQWAIHVPGKKRLRHREHPFFSADPPKELVSRLAGLRFSLAEEENATLVDALDRVRLALDTTSELGFVRKPWYAEQSDKLAMAMQTGGDAAFHAFVVFHINLLRWGGRRITKKIGIDPEDAEQIAAFTLMRAARHFKPSLGYQFSTYACAAFKRDAERCYGQPFLAVQVSANAYRWFRYVKRELNRRLARDGPDAATDFLNERVGVHAKTAMGFTWVEAVTSAEPLPPLADCQKNWDGTPLVDFRDGAHGLHREAMSGIIRSAMLTLSDSDRRLIDLRYGFTGREHTLEEIGREFKLTKERIRQKQIKAEAALRKSMLELLGEPPDPPDRAAPRSSVQATEEKAKDTNTDLPAAAPATQEAPTIFVLTSQPSRTQGELFAHAH